MSPPGPGPVGPEDSATEALQVWVTRLVRPEVRALTAYHVPAPGDLVKLDAMENPYAWPGALEAAWHEALRALQVNRYPDPGARALKRRLRQAMGVPAEAELLLGNGSDELIQLILLALARPGARVLAPEPTFVMYRLLATAAGMEFVGVPLRGEDFGLDLDAFRQAMERVRPAVIFLAYPNNPTGILYPREQLQEILSLSPGLVVVDEAYTPFAQDSFLADLGEHPNLLVMRTVSKMGLAGLRLGWLAGAAAWIRELDKLRLPYNINSLTQISADFALAHLPELEKQTAIICEQREILASTLARIPGVRVWPSRANFLLFRVSPGTAEAVFEGLRRRGVLIKRLSGSHPLLLDCLRVTVGTPAENQVFLAALEASLAEA